MVGSVKELQIAFGVGVTTAAWRTLVAHVLDKFMMVE
jgi:hypothetical protein